MLECLPENLESMNGDIAVVCCMILESTVSGSREDFKKEMFRWTIRRLEHNFVRRKEDTKWSMSGSKKVLLPIRSCSSKNWCEQEVHMNSYGDSHLKNYEITFINLFF